MSGQILALSRVLRTASSPLYQQSVRTLIHKSRIGNREVVGWGANGECTYFDILAVPFPAIRWREATPEIKVLKEKEKGDWKKLSVEEKKALYRASFCQTFAEMQAPTGQWKSILGVALGAISCGIWIYVLIKLFVYPPLPESFELEHRQALLKRMIDIGVDPVEGLSSKWDYEKGTWKK